MHIIRKIHLWLALPLGIVMSLVCATGAMLLVEKTVTELFNPGFYDQKTATEMTAPPSTCTGDCQNCKTGCPPPSAPRPVTSKPRRLAFFDKVLKLHRWLLDSPQTKGERTTGKTVVGITVLCFVAELFTGFVLWWPRSRKVLRNRLKVQCNKGWRRFFYDLHVSLGFWTLPLLLVISLTGLTWSFPQWGEVAAGFLRCFVEEDEVKKTIFALHTGTWAGAAGQTLYFLCCLTGTALPLTGLYFWWKRGRKRQ